MKAAVKYLLLLSFSGVIYVSLELAFRGRSHLSMLYCAMFCAIPIIMLNDIFSYEMDYFLQVIICTFFCTLFELIFGIIFNQFHDIWDYRNMPGSLFNGQICLIFILVWAAISAIFIVIMDLIDYFIFNYIPEKAPYYKIFGKVIIDFSNISKSPYDSSKDKIPTKSGGD